MERRILDCKPMEAKKKSPLLRDHENKEASNA